MTLLEQSVTVIEQEIDSSETVSEDVQSPSNALDCNGTDPRAKIINNGTSVCEFFIMSPTSDLLGGVSDIQPGETTDWIDFSEGMIIFVVNFDGVNGEKVSIAMANCDQATLEVGPDNQILSVTQEFNY